MEVCDCVPGRRTSVSRCVGSPLLRVCAVGADDPLNRPLTGRLPDSRHTMTTAVHEGRRTETSDMTLEVFSYNRRAALSVTSLTNFYAIPMARRWGLTPSPRPAACTC